MGISYSIDRESGLLQTNWVGAIDGADFVSAYLRILGDPRLGAVTHEIADLTGVTRITLPVTAMKRVIAEVARRHPGARLRTAVIAPQDAQFGLARMYGSHATLAEIGEVRPFRTRRDALAWLERVAHAETAPSVRQGLGGRGSSTGIPLTASS